MRYETYVQFPDGYAVEFSQLYVEEVGSGGLEGLSSAHGGSPVLVHFPVDGGSPVVEPLTPSF